MTQVSWPQVLSFDAQKQDIINTLNSVLSTRERDIQDYFDLPQQFIGGRKVSKIPTSSADYNSDTDLVGDVNYDLSYLYILVDNGAGSAVWRRVSLSAW